MIMWKGIISLAVGITLIALSDAIISTRYMVNYCRSTSTIHVNGSLILELTDSPVENRYDTGYVHCATNIVADTHSKVYLHFIVLDIAHESETPDRFHIYDFNDEGVKVQVTPLSGIYGVFEKPYYTSNTADMPIRDYQSSGNKFRLDFLGKPTYMYQGFTILLTSVRESRHGGCDKGYFYCEKQDICIPGELRCDSQSNCGALDGSDEFNCGNLEETVTNLLSRYSVFHAVLAAVIGVIVFLLCAVCIFVFIKKYNRQKYPLIKARAYMKRGVCTVTTNIDMERLYAPPSYENIMAGTSRGNDPPPEYSEYIRTTLHRDQNFTDSEDDDDNNSLHRNNTGKEFIDLHPKRKAPAPKRSFKLASVHNAMCHDRPATPENISVPSASASDEIRTNSRSSDVSNSSTGFCNLGDDSNIDSETELKSGDSGIENSREQISKIVKEPVEVEQSEKIL